MHSLRPGMQYATLAQQRETAQLGMWAFITTETLFFGALIFTYFIYRNAYPHDFALAGKDAVLWCGSVNIGLLLTSSLTMVLAIDAAAEGLRRSLVFWLFATVEVVGLYWSFVDTVLVFLYPAIYLVGR